MPEHPTTLVVLAGGYGSRIGIPKGHLQVNGRPILDRLVDRLRWKGPTLVVTAPGMEHPPGWQLFDQELCDPVAGQGPLRGIVTALESGIQSAIVVPVDMPMLTTAMLRWLADLPVDCGVFLQRNGQVESMPVLLHKSAFSIARQRLVSGRRSVHGLATEPGFSIVTAPTDWPDDVWTNVNEPADLAKLNLLQAETRSV